MSPVASPGGTQGGGRARRGAGAASAARLRLTGWFSVLGVWSAGLLWLAGGTDYARAQSLFISRDTVSAEVETAYIKGLKYLVTSQKPDGSWGDQYGQEPGVVGLAMMAVLAHGDDPNTGPFSEMLKRSVRYILSKADVKTGQIGLASSRTMYSHGFSTLALAEAYGAIDEPLIGPVLQRAVDLIVASQKRNAAGAWRYSADASDADTTVAGAQMVALFAARNAGLNVPDEAIEKGLKFYKACQDGSGGIGYTSGSGGGTTTTAIGMLVFALARQKDTPAYRSAAGFFQRQGFPSSYPFYHEYYAAQAAFHSDEPTWQAWNLANISRIIRMQDANGNWNGNCGASFSTSGALLSLALNYRYLPIYER